MMLNSGIFRIFALYGIVEKEYDRVLSFHTVRKKLFQYLQIICPFSTYVLRKVLICLNL